MSTLARPRLQPPPQGERPTLADLPNVSSRAYRTGRNLVVMTIVIVVVNRLFTEVVPVVPRFFNFVDVPLVALLVLYAAVGLPERRAAGLRPGFGPGMGAFLAVWGVSMLLNVDRVEPAPALLFLYGFLGPLVAYAAAYRIWPVGQAGAMSRTLVALGLLQFVVVAVFNLPKFAADPNPDYISGTFGENAYQLVFFLLIFGTLVAGIAAFERGTLVARMAPALIGGAFLVIFLAQYRSLLLTTALAAVLTSVMIARARGRGVLVAVMTVGALVGGFLLIVDRFPLLRFDRAVFALGDDPVALASGKLQAAESVAAMFAENGRHVAIGAGPGTYSSRAWRTFSLVGTIGGHADVAGPYVQALLGNAGYRTDVSDRYVVPQLVSRQDILGSRVLAAPFSSYLALPAEAGVIGAAILLGIYFTALSGTLRRASASMRLSSRGDPLPALALAAGIALFVLLQAALFDNWLEGARVTIPSWILVAVTTKEYQARRILGWTPVEGRDAG